MNELVHDEHTKKKHLGLTLSNGLIKGGGGYGGDVGGVPKPSFLFLFFTYKFKMFVTVAVFFFYKKPKNLLLEGEIYKFDNNIDYRINKFEICIRHRVRKHIR